MKIKIIEITCVDKEEAQRLADLLLVKKLIACANIIPGVGSLYRWEERIENERETILLLKTVEDKTNEIVEIIKKEHSSDVPAVVLLDAESLNDKYSDWMNKEIG